MHLRIVARVRTLGLLERQDNANRNHVRNTEVTAEPDVAMRTFVPLSDFADEAPAKASTDDQFEVWNCFVFFVFFVFFCFFVLVLFLLL